MLHAAICDDDPDIRAMLRDYLDRFSHTMGFLISTSLFESGEALLAEDLSGLDLLILDIQMAGMDGLSTARAIRGRHQNLTIIFFTNYIQYALEGYEVQAYRFLLKPLSYERFAQVVGQALTELHSRKEAMLVVRTKTRTSSIPIDSLLYAETYKGHVLLHTAGDTVEAFESMKELESALKEHGFLRCHTAFLVSLREIRSVTSQDVLLRGGQVLPLSKHRRKTVREAVTIFWGEQFL